MLESYLKAATGAINNPRVNEDELQLIWSALPQKAINNITKDFRKRMQE